MFRSNPVNRQGHQLRDRRLIRPSSPCNFRMIMVAIYPRSSLLKQESSKWRMRQNFVFALSSLMRTRHSERHDGARGQVRQKWWFDFRHRGWRVNPDLILPFALLSRQVHHDIELNST